MEGKNLSIEYKITTEPRLSKIQFTVKIVAGYLNAVGAVKLLSAFDQYVKFSKKDIIGDPNLKEYIELVLDKYSIRLTVISRSEGFGEELIKRVLNNPECTSCGVAAKAISMGWQGIPIIHKE